MGELGTVFQTPAFSVAVTVEVGRPNFVKRLVNFITGKG
jgi:hypothetical protein